MVKLSQGAIFRERTRKKRLKRLKLKVRDIYNLISRTKNQGKCGRLVELKNKAENLRGQYEKTKSELSNCMRNRARFRERVNEIKKKLSSKKETLMDMRRMEIPPDLGPTERVPGLDTPMTRKEFSEEFRRLKRQKKRLKGELEVEKERWKNWKEREEEHRQRSKELWEKIYEEILSKDPEQILKEETRTKGKSKAKSSRGWTQRKLRMYKDKLEKIRKNIQRWKDKINSGLRQNADEWQIEDYRRSLRKWKEKMREFKAKAEDRYGKPPRYGLNLPEKGKLTEEEREFLTAPPASKMLASTTKVNFKGPTTDKEKKAPSRTGKPSSEPKGIINALMSGVSEREIKEKIGSMEKLRQLINKPRFRKAAVRRAKKAYSEQETYANVSQMKDVTAIRKKPRIAFYALLDKLQESKKKRPRFMKKMGPSPMEPTEEQKKTMEKMKKEGKKEKLKRKVKGMLKEELEKELKKELKREVKRQASEEIEKGS